MVAARGYVVNMLYQLSGMVMTVTESHVMSNIFATQKHIA